MMALEIANEDQGAPLRRTVRDLDERVLRALGYEDAGSGAESEEEARMPIGEVASWPAGAEGACGGEVPDDTCRVWMVGDQDAARHSGTVTQRQCTGRRPVCGGSTQTIAVCIAADVTTCARK